MLYAIKAPEWKPWILKSGGHRLDVPGGYMAIYPDAGEWVVLILMFGTHGSARCGPPVPTQFAAMEAAEEQYRRQVADWLTPAILGG